MGIWLIVVIVVVIIVIVAIIGLALAYHTFSFTIVESSGLLGGSGSFTKSFPVGAQISGSWSTPTGVSVTLSIDTPGGTSVFIGDSYSGSFSFTANYASYSFITFSDPSTTVSVTGSYWAF